MEERPRVNQDLVNAIHSESDGEVVLEVVDQRSRLGHTPEDERRTPSHVLRRTEQRAKEESGIIGPVVKDSKPSDPNAPKCRICDTIEVVHDGICWRCAGILKELASLGPKASYRILLEHLDQTFTDVGK